jgi:proteasome lid subunit RPN8/RPN11
MLIMTPKILKQIHEHGEVAYPEEGVGFMLGKEEEGGCLVVQLYEITNAREEEARKNRYQVTPRDYLQAEVRADQLGMSLIGVFHSHPDHPNQPSEYDREWAQPNFSYVITNVNLGTAVESRSWRLEEDRSRFIEEHIHIKG